jgi:hypothetical protein
LPIGVEALGAEDLHPADAQFRQEHHGHDDDPDAAEPLQQAAPQVEPAGSPSSPEKTVAPVVVSPDIASKNASTYARRSPSVAPEDEGQRAEDRQHQPHARGQQKGLLDRQPRA